MQLTLEGKTIDEKAIERIKTFEPPEGYQLAFSGGKDSVVVYDLAKRSGVKFHPFFNWTGIDPPELYRFVREHYPELEIRKPELNMWELIRLKKMLPLAQARFCCEYLKERSNTGTLLTGVRWQESIARRKRRMVELSYTRPEVKFVHPIIDWRSSDVWQYIRERHLPYCELYDRGFKRIGCLFCPMASKAETERCVQLYPKYVAMWKRACDWLVANGYGWQFKSGEELFRWWISRKRVSSEDKQCPFFL
jgi:phosphoadenosine phosphosulfate reductase